MGEAPKAQHAHKTLIFPEDFLWGAATSAHQVEGDNFYNDWWAWEQTLPEEHHSGKADDQYHLFEEDFSLVKAFGHNAHRLSIEWSRIEPEEGKFDQAAIDHYKKVLQSLKDKKITVMLTLWHFTLPQWLSQKGGWVNPNSAKYFERFVAKIVPEIKDQVDFWITINEPGIYAWGSYYAAIWPPNKKSLWRQVITYLNLVSAHKKAYKKIHKLVPHSKVGMSNNLFSFANQQSHSILQHLLVWLYDIWTNHLFYILSSKKTHDFIGINYYLHQRIGSHNGSKYPRFLDASFSKKDVSDLGWEVYPEGIYDVLRDMADYNLPIYITENGLASTNDDRRCRFLIGYLKEIYHAIFSGVNIKGYFHWSLIDNFEWAEGFRPRFGLIEVDYQTQKRIPRASAYVYADIIKNNGITHHLMRFVGHTVQAEEVLGRLQDCVDCQPVLVK